MSPRQRHAGLKFVIHAVLIVAIVAVVAAVTARFAPWEFTAGNLVLRSQRGMTHPFPRPVEGDLENTTRIDASTIEEASRPRNIILVIGDGMGVGQVSSASLLLHGPRGGLTLETAPVTGLMSTHAGNLLVTDSAASSTAMATGFKARKKAISKLEDGRVPVTIFEAARAIGMATGVVTTGGLIDATPAGFNAHQEKREKYPEILEDTLASGTDVLIGGDWSDYAKAKMNPEFQGMMNEIETLGAEAGYSVVRDPAGLASAGDPVLAVFPPRDRGGDGHGPPLPEVVTFAIDRLQYTGNGFLLLVESELTDGLAHDNDIEATVAAVRELDDTVAAILAWAKPRGDTLVIVTADHDTGGLGIVDGYYDEGVAEVRWATDRHTAQWVPLFAFGPGAEHFAGVIDNTDIAILSAKLLGIEDFPRLHP